MQATLTSGQNLAFPAPFLILLLPNTPQWKEVNNTEERLNFFISPRLWPGLLVMFSKLRGGDKLPPVSPLTH